jgi:hypothetical protein
VEYGVSVQMTKQRRLKKGRNVRQGDCHAEDSRLSCPGTCRRTGGVCDVCKFALNTVTKETCYGEKSRDKRRCGRD